MRFFGIFLSLLFAIVLFTACSNDASGGSALSESTPQSHTVTQSSSDEIKEKIQSIVEQDKELDAISKEVEDYLEGQAAASFSEEAERGISSSTNFK